MGGVPIFLLRRRTKSVFATGSYTPLTPLKPHFVGFPNFYFVGQHSQPLRPKFGTFTETTPLGSHSLVLETHESPASGVPLQNAQFPLKKEKKLIIINLYNILNSQKIKINLILTPFQALRLGIFRCMSHFFYILWLILLDCLWRSPYRHPHHLLAPYQRYNHNF